MEYHSMFYNLKFIVSMINCFHNYLTSPVFMFRVTGVTPALHCYICIVFIYTPEGWTGYIAVLSAVQINQK
jgi:hypothetical protein